MLKYDGVNGHLIWSRYFRGADTSGINGYNRAGDLKIDPNQNIIISGVIYNYDSVTRGDAFSAQLDIGGNVLWTDTFDYGNNQNEIWRSILLKNNNEGFYVVGSTDTHEFSNQSFMVNAFYCKNPCTVSVEENSKSVVSIYPNPTSAKIKIEIDAKIDEIIVKDIFGRNIIELKKLNQSGDELDISSLKSVTYLIQIKTEQKVITKKIIKL